MFSQLGVHWRTVARLTDTEKVKQNLQTTVSFLYNKDNKQKCILFMSGYDRTKM